MQVELDISSDLKFVDAVIDMMGVGEKERKTKLIHITDLDKEDRIVVRDTVDDFLVWLDRKRKAVSKKMKTKNKKEEVAQQSIP